MAGPEVLQRLGFRPEAKFKPGRYGHEDWQWWKLTYPVHRYTTRPLSESLASDPLITKLT